MRRLLAVLLVLACGCAHVPAPPGGDSGFLELEGEHYLLLTDLPEPDARAALVSLEDARGALMEASWRGRSLRQEKLRVLELAWSARLHEFASPSMSAFYQRVDLFDEPLLVMTADRGTAGQAILQHELAHALHGSFLPRNPRWFFEGAACYLETLRYDAAAERYRVGEPSPERLEFLRVHPGTDYAHVLSTPTREAVLMAGQDGYAFQSAAWMIVFYLANERGPALDDYVRRRARGEPAQSAFAAAFGGLAAEELSRAVEEYRRALQESFDGARPAPYRVREVRSPPWRGEVKVRPMPAAEVEALRAELFFLSPGLPREKARLLQARAALDRALTLDPLNPLALAVQAALAEGRDGSPPLEQIRAAARKHGEDFRAQMLLALAVGADRPDERRAALARAAELAPENATVLNAFAWHDLTHGRAAEAVAVARKAVDLAPGNADVLDTLASAVALSSRCEEATRLEEQAVELSAEHLGVERRRRLLDRLDAMHAGCAHIRFEE